MTQVPVQNVRFLMHGPWTCWKVAMQDFGPAATPAGPVSSK